jgi:TonB family protein
MFDKVNAQPSPAADQALADPTPAAIEPTSFIAPEPSPSSGADASFWTQPAAPGAAETIQASSDWSQAAAYEPAPVVESAPTEEEKERNAKAEALLAEAVREREARSEAIRAEGAKMEAARAEAERLEAIKAEMAREEAAHHERALASVPRPATARRPAALPVPPPKSNRAMTWAAVATAIVCAITLPLSARYFGVTWPLGTTHEEQQEQLTPTETLAEVKVEPPPIEVRRPAPQPTPKPAPASKLTKASVQSKAKAKPVSAARRSVSAPVEPVREASFKQVVAQPAPAAASASPAPAPVEARRPSASDAPVGRFFEPTDVDRSPRVATRVEPRLPANLSRKPVNEVVIVRVLVSQSGRPHNVSLLRRSKLGPSLDNAVVAAVNQWTFSPAQRRGESVSSWLNIGVPVGKAD